MARLEDDLAASFRQGDHLSKHDPTQPVNGILFGNRNGRMPEVGGICFALAAMWIARHLQHRAEGPAGRTDYLARENSIHRAWEIHHQAVGVACYANGASPPAMPEHHALEAYRSRALEPLGLTTHGAMPSLIGWSGRNMATEVAALHGALAGPRRYHLITLRGSGPASTHAMASYMAGGVNGMAQLHLFDPNWGEFKLSGRHFAAFIPHLLGWYDMHGEFGRITWLRVDSIAQ